MKLSCIKVALVASSLLLFSLSSLAAEHLIYSVAEDLPMGYENEVLRKNYYINMGVNQGVSSGTTLDVFRMISKSNPYDSKRRVNYQVKIGEIEVVHSEDEAAIGIMKKVYKEVKKPLVEINNFMIGDYVSVNIK